MYDGSQNAILYMKTILFIFNEGHLILFLISKVKVKILQWVSQ